MPQVIEGNGNAEEFTELAESVCERLAKNKRIYRNLPGNGRLRIDRQLPFLLVHRVPPGREDPGTARLVTTEAAFVYCECAAVDQDSFRNLCHRIQSVLLEHFGKFLMIEVWSTPPDKGNSEVSNDQLKPEFDIVCQTENTPRQAISALRTALAEVSISGHGAVVRTRTQQKVVPPGLAPLDNPASLNKSGKAFHIGLAVRPIYRNETTRDQFPLVLQALRTQLSIAIRKTVSVFAGVSTSGEAIPYESFGPSSLLQASRLVDTQLSELSEAFDFVLQVTPANTSDAWEEFKQGGLSTPPVFRYRPLPYHPSLLKRKLFEIPIETVEDTTLANLFWEKQDELNRQLSALRDLDTPRFLYGSIQIYGEPEAPLIDLAHRIMKAVDEREVSESSEGHLHISEVIDAAREEISRYQQQLRAFEATVEISSGIASGMMVSQGRLLVSRDLKVRPNRLAQLLDHEIGTHLLTYFNGRTQPLKQLFTGLAGYEDLQEGLAILAEYLAGGLTLSRLRTLAARVVAAKSLTDGEPFMDTFERLHSGHGMDAHQAFMTSLRAHRAGGMTKDIIYLSGFQKVLDYLSKGHDLEPLYVGKIGIQHIPSIQELRRRGIIVAPAVLPRFWEVPRLRERLNACRGLSVLDLLKEESP